MTFASGQEQSLELLDDLLNLSRSANYLDEHIKVKRTEWAQAQMMCAREVLKIIDATIGRVRAYLDETPSP